MKMLARLWWIALVLSIGSLAAADVSVRVCLSDGNTPLAGDVVFLQEDAEAGANTVSLYRDIMVGTKLTIIVASDSPGTWSGGLFIEDTDRDYGALSARDYNDITHDWQGSHFAAAGQRARVFRSEDSSRSGFDVNSHNTASPGDWFIIDYTATQVGSCRVELYYNPSAGVAVPSGDFSVPPDPPGAPVVLSKLFFSQAPTRDFNQDGVVDFADFAVLASYWGAIDCAYPDWCQGVDLNADAFVDSADLLLFAEYWLEKTSAGAGTTDDGR